MKKITIDQNRIEKLIDYYISTGYRFEREQGGILLGKYVNYLCDFPDGSIEITSIIRMKNEHSIYFKFFARRGFFKLMLWLFFKTKNKVQYVGDWHFHVSDSAEPSKQDIDTMKKKAKIFRRDMALLIISRTFEVTITQFHYAKGWRGFKNFVGYETKQVPLRGPEVA